MPKLRTNPAQRETTQEWKIRQLALRKSAELRCWRRWLRPWCARRTLAIVGRLHERRLELQATAREDHRRFPQAESLAGWEIELPANKSAQSSEQFLVIRASRLEQLPRWCIAP